MPRPTASSRRRLMVEGLDDQWSVINLLARHWVDWNADGPSLPFVEDCKGKDRLLPAIGTASRSLDRLGVVLDADHDPEARWQQAIGRFGKEGILFPSRPDPAGAVVQRDDGKRFGIWLMPDNRVPGILEDFLATLVPPGDATWPHARAATLTARELGAPLAEADLSKGTLHTWLAWREQSGVPFGTALTSAVLLHDSEAALAFLAWFRRLFLAA